MNTPSFKLKSQFIDPSVLKVIQTLQKNGHTTYVVGGCVRDLYLGIQPKDFDVATSAKPNQVKKLIKGSYVIGRRFRLVLVQRTNLQIEIATFRKSIPENLTKASDAPYRDNFFGSPQQDSQRRDFTANGLFYDPIKDKLFDYCNGIDDLKKRVLRMIGDPSIRLPEDSIRILRAIRLSQKIGFRINKNLRKQIKSQAFTLENSALTRRREEFIKFLKLKEPHLAFLEAYDLDVLKYTVPLLHQAFEQLHFTDQFSQIKSTITPNSHPVLLLGHLIHTYVRSFIHTDPLIPIRAKNLLEHPDLSKLMKDQLNIFKYEQSHICIALQMELTLKKRKEFEQRNSKRQFVVISNEAFPLAFEFAKKDQLLSGSDILFWENTFEKFKKEISDKYNKRPKHSALKDLHSTKS